MSKNIVFCADGTWNGPGQDDNGDGVPDTTNVFKLFCNLGGTPTPDSMRLKNEQESVLRERGQAIQVAKYIHGVGDSDNLLTRLLGGTFGAGVISRIVRGYTFVSRSYAAGDKIFLVGFSRGAYTVRALAGLIAAKGLLNPAQIDLGDRTSAYRAGAAVWYDCRKSAIAAKSNWLCKLEELAADLPGFLTAAPTDQRVAAPIEAVAVWDTVGALGIPQYALGGDRRVDALQFADTALNAAIHHGIHAISIDEGRVDFSPTLWELRVDIRQRLFPGAHADVGGGYPTSGNESGLSDGALQWMATELSGLGVRFAALPAFVLAPDACATAHQPWRNPPWSMFEPHTRELPAFLRTSLDPAVAARRNGGNVKPDPCQPAGPYRPANIPG